MPRKTSLASAEIGFSGGAQFKTAREREEVSSLVRRLVASAGIAVADLTPSAICLEALSGGRSAARVFKLTPLFGSRPQAKGAPVVVKIAPHAEGAGERANYDKFARWGLPAACRPELLGFARTRAYSGLCYSFVGDSSGSRAITLTECLQRGDAAKLELVLRGIFDRMRNTWYSPALVRAERDIAQRYLDRHFSGPRSVAATEVTLRACAARYFSALQESGPRRQEEARRGEGDVRPGKRDARYLIGPLSFPSLRKTLFESGRKRPYLSCIVHGDLHSDNILVTDHMRGMGGHAPGVSVVDFLKTGRGHVLEDLIAVESSIRINYARDASFPEILEKERLIAMGPWGRRPRNDSRGGPLTDPYCESIRKIRAAALSYFGRAEVEANYSFAVAAIGLRLMLATDLSHTARARITASALWSAKALEGQA